MRLLLISVGRRMPTWVNEGFADYAKRLRGSARLELVEVEPCKRSRKTDVEQLVREEGERLLSVAPPDHRLVALDIMGKQISSEDLAGKLGDWIELAAELPIDGLEFYCAILDLADSREWPTYRKMAEDKGLTIPMMCCSPDFTLSLIHI